MVGLKLGQGLEVLWLWPWELSRVWEIRVKLVVWRRSGKIVGIRLTGHRLSAGVDDDYMTLFKVLDESMEILEVETAASVIAAEFIFAFHGGERVHDGTSVRLDGGGNLSCISEVGGIYELTGG